MTVVLLLIFLSLAVFAGGVSLRSSNDASPCSTCSDLCILLPPGGSQLQVGSKSSFPCYQGEPDDAAKCFLTDPLLLPGTTWQCGLCTDAGYAVYYGYDPLYTTMQLWMK
mmetsp:Transcript_5173/g.7137  ORF Transcript_5173/g.7137 Transcript_5173/m.7137 type:complete len:110 (-) Transcript_5173:1416-1745(-)